MSLGISCRPYLISSPTESSCSRFDLDILHGLLVRYEQRLRQAGLTLPNASKPWKPPMKPLRPILT